MLYAGFGFIFAAFVILYTFSPCTLSEVTTYEGIEICVLLLLLLVLRHARIAALYLRGVPWHMTSSTLTEDFDTKRRKWTPVLAPGNNKKLSCREDTARCFVSLNILLNGVRPLETTLLSRRKSLLVYHCNCGCMSYHFPGKATIDHGRTLSTITIFSYRLHLTSPLGRFPSEYCQNVMRKKLKWCQCHCQ